MLTSFDFFSCLQRKKRSGVWRKKSQELLVFASKSDLIQVGKKGKKKRVEKKETEKLGRKYVNIEFFPHGLQGAQLVQ